MKLLWLRFRYGLEMSAAYLASHSREPDVMNAHERAAREVQRLIHREMIN